MGRPIILMCSLALVAACGEGASSQRDKQRPVVPAVGVPAGLPTGSPVDSSDSGGPPEPSYDCTQPLPAAPVDPYQTNVGSKAEDFDFDIDGHVGFVDVVNMIGKTIDDVPHLISPDLDQWITGNRILSTGDWVALQAQVGNVVLIDAVTGAKSTLIGNMSFPNGLEVGTNDDLFLTDYTAGEVWRVNAWNTDDRELIAQGLALPNGIALSPDAQTLYIGEDTGARILRYEKQPGGGWSGGGVLIDTTDMYQGMTVDYCGNIYIIRTMVSEAAVMRITPSGDQVEFMTVLPTWYATNLRFGTGVGGWEPTHIYSTDRTGQRFLAFDVGIPGKRHVQLP